MGFDEALGLSSVLILVFLEDWLWTCGYGGVTESTESPPASSSLSFLFVIFSIILLKLSFNLNPIELDVHIFFLISNH
jgi:H+/Cl- antiporter ClcA